MTAHTVTLTHTHTLTAHTHTRITHTHTHSTLTPLVLHGDSLHTQLVLNPRTRQIAPSPHLADLAILGFRSITATCLWRGIAARYLEYLLTKVGGPWTCGFPWLYAIMCIAGDLDVVGLSLDQLQFKAIWFSSS